MRTRALITALALTLVTAPLATAQDKLTWVSSLGSDADTCSRTAPCRTFSGALAKTADNGEIHVLDSGDFGAVNVTKSVAIVNEGSFAGVFAGTSFPFLIDTPGIRVVLRGLQIHSDGADEAPARAIWYLRGASLTVEGCRIYGFRGEGIEVGAAVGRMFVRDTIISRNIKGGIVVSGGVQVALDNVRLDGNGGFHPGAGLIGAGLRMLGGEAWVRNSTAVGNVGNGFNAVGPAVINIYRSLASRNGQAGIRAAGTGGVLRISESTVTDNQWGLLASPSAFIVSFGNNSVFGNDTDGEPTSTVSPR